MPRLLSSALSFRRDPRLLKLPSYASLLFIVVGVVWLLVLPLDEYSRKTYISENALLPGQVHTYFGGSENNVLQGYRAELDTWKDRGKQEINDKLESILKGVGIKVGRQSYTYHSAGETFSGENLYGILQAPRGDATEAIVLVAAWESISGQLNRNGVSLALTLARYFKRWSLWSKDIILLIPADSKTATQAWVDAYHDAHDPATVASLPLKSGALQGVLALDFPEEKKFQALHIIYDGINGQLPNLDLLNAVSNVAGGQMGIPTTIQGVEDHSGHYLDRLRTITRGMMKQAIGYATGPHSSFIPYHVDAVTIQPYGDGFMDEMALGRIVEGSFRSLNNLLEHLHQSFFFYLLMQKDRFVSIGTYLPSAMLLAANFTIMAIGLWLKSGQPDDILNQDKHGKKGETKLLSETVLERNLGLPLRIVGGCQALSAIPLFVFNNLPANMLSPAFAAFTIISSALPLILSFTLPGISRSSKPLTLQHYQVTKSFSLLLLGMVLSTLATLNFSLAFLIGLFSTPLTFVRPVKSLLVRWTLVGFMTAISPPVLLYTVCAASQLDVGAVLKDASFGWNVWGLYTAVVVWCVWWPAWLVGTMNVLGSISE